MRTGIVSWSSSSLVSVVDEPYQVLRPSLYVKRDSGILLFVYTVFLITLLRNLPWSWVRLGKRNSICLVAIPASTAHLPRSGSSLASPHQTHRGTRINEQLAGIELRRNSVFRSRIVKGVLVVPVVPSFSNRHKRHKRILGRMHRLVIRPVSIHVRQRIHTPRKMQHRHVS